MRVREFTGNGTKYTRFNGIFLNVVKTIHIMIPSIKTSLK